MIEIDPTGDSMLEPREMPLKSFLEHPDRQIRGWAYMILAEASMYDMEHEERLIPLFCLEREIKLKVSNETATPQ